MKLLELELRDFLNHRETRLEFGGVTLIAGPNNSGKSAVKDALELLLTGVARSTDRAGRGANELVRSGADGFSIRGVLEAGGHRYEVERQLTTDGQELTVTVDGKAWAGGLKLVQRRLLEELGADAATFSALMHAGHPMDMAPKDQERLLFTVAGLRFQGSDVHALLKTAGCTDEDVRLLYDDNLERLVPAHMDKDETYGPEVFDACHSFAYKARTEVNRTLKESRTVLEAERGRLTTMEREDLRLRGLTEDQMAKMEVLKVELEHERDELLKASAPESTALKRGELEEMVARLEGEAAAVRAWQTKMDSLRSADPAQLLATNEELREQARAEEARSKATLGVLRAAVKAFSDADAKCPLTREQCPVAASEPAREKVLTALRARIETGEQALADAVRIGEEAQSAMDAVNAIGPMPGRAVEVIEVELTNAREMLRALPSDEEASGGTDETLEKLTTRIKDATPKLMRGRRYLDQVERVGQVTDRVGKLEEELAAWERLVAALGPGGVKSVALDAPLAALEVSLNERLARYSRGYELALFREGDGVRFRVKVGEGPGHLSTDALSTSERLRVGVALQEGLATLSGLRFLLVDNVDMLDQARRDAFVASVLEMAPDYDSIVLLATLDAPPAVRASADVRTWWLTGEGADEQGADS